MKRRDVNRKTYVTLAAVYRKHATFQISQLQDSFLSNVIHLANIKRTPQAPLPHLTSVDFVSVRETQISLFF